MKRVIIVCGGTGGHLTPGIALAQRLRDRGVESTLVVSRKEIDARLCKDYDDLDFESIAGSGFSLRPDRLLRFVGNFFHALFQSLALIRRKKVDAVVAFGGFTSLPMGLAAKLLGKKLLLHESNRVMGKATAVLAPVADRVYLPGSLKAHRKFVGRGKFLAAGFPLRRDFVPLDRADARRILGFPEDGKLLLITGGSQGARALVDWLNENLDRLCRSRISVFCLTGLAGLDREMEIGEWGVKIVHRRFCCQMHVLLSAADLMVARAGAGTIAELIRCHLPTILVPFPFAAKDHQRINGQFLADCSAAKLLEQKDLDKLFDLVKSTIQNPNDLEAMADRLKILDRETGDAAAQMVDGIVEVL